MEIQEQLRLSEEQKNEVLAVEKLIKDATAHELTESAIVDMMQESHYKLAAGEQKFITKNLSQPGKPVNAIGISIIKSYY